MHNLKPIEYLLSSPKYYYHLDKDLMLSLLPLSPDSLASWLSRPYDTLRVTVEHYMKDSTEYFGLESEIYEIPS
jgi:hypothetical protein